MFTLRGQQYVTYIIFRIMPLLLQALLAKQSEKKYEFWNAISRCKVEPPHN